MLREIRFVKQERGKDAKRWFTDEDWDVFVWNREDGSHSGMQLCYGKQGYQRALTWLDGQEPSHTGVDEGADITKNQAPILVQDGSLDTLGLAKSFARASREIDPRVRTYVISKLKELLRAGW